MPKQSPQEDAPLPFLIKILHEAKSGAVRKQYGHSGKRYIFNWDQKARAYLYQPMKQEEVDDLCRTMGRSFSAIYAPLALPEAPVKVEGKAQPEPSPAEVTHSVAILTEADSRGIEIREGDTDEVLARLVQVHDFAKAKFAPLSSLSEPSDEDAATPEPTPEPEAPAKPKGKPGRKGTKNHSAGEPDNDATG